MQTRRGITRLLVWLYAKILFWSCWLVIGMFLLLIPLFMLAMVALFLENVSTRPVGAAGNSLAGCAIGSFLFWATWNSLKSMRVWRRRMISGDVGQTVDER
jgi:hypothetical protein